MIFLGVSWLPYVSIEAYVTFLLAYACHPRCSLTVLKLADGVTTGWIVALCVAVSVFLRGTGRRAVSGRAFGFSPEELVQAADMLRAPGGQSLAAPAPSSSSFSSATSSSSSSDAAAVSSAAAAKSGTSPSLWDLLQAFTGEGDDDEEGDAGGTGNAAGAGKRVPSGGAHTSAFSSTSTTAAASASATAVSVPWPSQRLRAYRAQQWLEVLIPGLRVEWRATGTPQP